MKTNNGFGIVGVLIVVAVIAVLGYLGWVYWNSTQEQASQQAFTAIEESTPPAIETSQDLSESETYLGELDITTALDTSDIDAVLE